MTTLRISLRCCPFRCILTQLDQGGSAAYAPQRWPLMVVEKALRREAALILPKALEKALGRQVDVTDPAAGAADGGILDAQS